VLGGLSKRKDAPAEEQMAERSICTPMAKVRPIWKACLLEPRKWWSLFSAQLFRNGRAASVFSQSKELCGLAESDGSRRSA
jgi:hypothetical protein